MRKVALFLAILLVLAIPIIANGRILQQALFCDL